MFGYSAVAELRGKLAIELVEARHRPEVAERNRQRELGRNVPESYMTLGLRKDGTTFPCRLDVAKMDLSDGPATVAFMIDLSGVVTGEVGEGTVNGDSVAAGVLADRG